MSFKVGDGAIIKPNSIFYFAFGGSFGPGTCFKVEAISDDGEVVVTHGIKIPLSELDIIPSEVLNSPLYQLLNKKDTDEA